MDQYHIMFSWKPVRATGWGKNKSSLVGKRVKVVLTQCVITSWTVLLNTVCVQLNLKLCPGEPGPFV